MFRLLTVFIVTTLLASPAIAQLDLPSRGSGGDGGRPAARSTRPQRGTVAPFLTCSVCGDRNYTTRIERTGTSGQARAFCTVCRKMRVHERSSGSSGVKRGSGLDLPGGELRSGSPQPPAPMGGEAGTPSAERPAEVGPVRGPRSAVAGGYGAAEFVFGEVERAKRVDDPLVTEAIDGLLALGDSGIEAASGALASSHAPTLWVAASVLLKSGVPEAADLVVERVRDRMPTPVAGRLVEALVTHDPVRSGPELLGELLQHRQTAVRAASQRAIDELPDEAKLRAIEHALTSSSGDARERATELLATLPGAAAIDRLLERLDDPRAGVTRVAVESLAARDDERIVGELLTRAFPDRFLLRSSAYAVLALVEREDVRLEPIFGPTHVPTLLRSMDSTDPFVTGVAAAALAGIGFRADDGTTTPWLDASVPEALVVAVDGTQFFPDHASLVPTALRRLQLLSGRSFGTDGGRWAVWWSEAHEGFRASRARIQIPPGREGELFVHYRASGSDAASVRLIGPDLADSAEPLGAGEPFFLSKGESLDLIDLLRREGCLGTERLPGIRGAGADRGRSLELRLAGQAKHFVFGPTIEAPWFDRVAEMVLSLRSRNVWQRHANPALHRDRLTLWRLEGPWWAEEHTELERRMRLKDLVLARMAELPATERDASMLELERLYAEGANEQQDFPVLATCLGQETFFGGRAERLCALVEQAAGLTPNSSTDAEATPLAPEETEPFRRELIGLLHDRFSYSAVAPIQTLLEDAGPEAVRRAAQDERALLRAVSSHWLSQSAEPQDRALLEALFSDPSEMVVARALSAAGDEGLDYARAEVHLRARVGSPELRESALLATGRLGGEGALSVLLDGLTDEDRVVRVSAAEGLVLLEDPETAPLLVTLLRQGRDAEVFDAARRGLLRLGPTAWDDLFTAMRSNSPEARREAALLLSYQSRPEAASTLMRLLTETPDDRRVAEELTILSCVDLRDEVDPAAAWWVWWDGVVHDDAFVWLRAALELWGVPSPSAKALEDEYSIDRARYLISALRLQDDWIVERARRELEHTLRKPVEDPPEWGPSRDAWLQALEDVLAQGGE